MPDIVNILEKAGFTVVEGKDAVLDVILEKSDGVNQRLCSGYRIFPDGSKCFGCKDCEGKEVK